MSDNIDVVGRISRDLENEGINLSNDKIAKVMNALKQLVKVYYQGSTKHLGVFETLEQATLANEIARSMFKKSTSSVLLNEQEIEAIKRAAVKGVSEMNMEKEKDYFI